MHACQNLEGAKHQAFIAYPSMHAWDALSIRCFAPEFDNISTYAFLKSSLDKKEEGEDEEEEAETEEEEDEDGGCGGGV